MSIEEAIMGGIVFKGKKDKPQEDEKVKTKAKKATYIRGQHGSGAAKMKADIRKKEQIDIKNKNHICIIFVCFYIGAVILGICYLFS